MLCDQCGQEEATLMRYGGMMWNPICDECAEWWGPHRIKPLDEDVCIEDEAALLILETDTATSNYE